MAQILLLSFLQFLVISVLFYILHKENREERDSYSLHIQNILNNLLLQNKTFIDSTSKIVTQTTNTYITQSEKLQAEHFKQLEKQSGKQLSLLTTQAKDFLKHMGTLTAKPEPAVIGPQLLNNEVNTIEKEDIPEIPLEEAGRIPMVDGIKVQFEDDPENIFPIDITSVGGMPLS